MYLLTYPHKNIPAPDIFNYVEDSVKPTTATTTRWAFIVRGENEYTFARVRRVLHRPDRLIEYALEHSYIPHYFTLALAGASQVCVCVCVCWPHNFVRSRQPRTHARKNFPIVGGGGVPSPRWPPVTWPVRLGSVQQNRPAQLVMFIAESSLLAAASLTIRFFTAELVGKSKVMMWQALLRTLLCTVLHQLNRYYMCTSLCSHGPHVVAYSAQHKLTMVLQQHCRRHRTDC